MATKQKMKQINLVLCILTAIGGLCYNTIAHNLVMKTIASLGFTLIGVLNLTHGIRQGKEGQQFAKLMVAGLTIGMAADIVLEIHFMLGALIFALGHVFYILAYHRLRRFEIRDLIWGCFLLAALLGCILFLPIFDFGGVVMQGVCIFYAVLLSIMFGKAFANFKKAPKTLTKMLAIGSALFAFSDTMLLFSFFADTPAIVGSLCVNSYYPGQALIAASLLWMDESL